MFSFGQKENFKYSSTIINSSNIPLLILDTVWLSFFSKDYKNEKILFLEEEIKSIMKEEAKLIERKKVLELMKKKDIARIVELTNEVYEKENEVAKIDMQLRHDYILKSKEEYKEIEKRLKEIEEEKNNKNKKLLEETIYISYNLMKESKEALETLVPEIENMRKEIKEKIEQKVLKEEIYERTYNLIFRLVGKEVIEHLDLEYYKNKEK